MARFLCNVSCVISGAHFKQGGIYEAASNPNTDFFSTYSDDVLTDLGGGFQRDLDGTLYLPGGGWDDLTFPATGINPPGAASDPARSTADAMLEFSASATNILAGVAHLPHRKKFGTKIYPHIHWYPATDAAGDVYWRFEYKLVPVGNAIPANYTTINKTVATPEAVAHVITSFGGIAPGDTDLGTVLLWKLSRMGAEETDTYDAVARLMEFDIHFWQDSIGSGQEYSK